MMSFLSASDLSRLTMKEIRDLARSMELQIPVAVEKRRATMVDFVCAHASVTVATRLRECAEQKEASSSQIRQKRSGEMTEEEPICKRIKTDNVRVVKARQEYDAQAYLDLPTVETVHQCYENFYNATSNDAIRLVVCGVCGRELNAAMDKTELLLLKNIPHVHRLVPSERHPAHDLFEGHLLEPAGVSLTSSQENEVRLCFTCRQSLAKSFPDTPPALSLVNNMWIGRIPLELSCLTLPEQLLLAHVYPRVYVFKLYPKKGNFCDSASLQRGMKGTVSSHELDLPGIAAMLEGRLMPRPPSILAAVIAVTFIGAGQLPRDSFCSLFQVRRSYVAAALRWLKDNNSKYYGDILIDEARLSLLPENDVPVELLHIVRQTEDVGVIDQESDGYVPTNEESNIGMFFFLFVLFNVVEYIICDQIHPILRMLSPS
jgi:hypothetical protein